MVLAEIFREKRRKDQERRIQEASTQALDEGLTKGRDEVQARWESWNSRREEAEKNNLSFDEPPPSLEDSENGSIS